MTRRTTRLRSSRRSVRLDFGAIEIIGGLLTPDIIARIAAFEAHGQNEESYSVPPGLKIRDEIARYFRIGEALWARFDAARASSPAASEKFVLDLLKQCFGFDTLRPQAAIHMGEREFPVRHAAVDGRVPVVIAPVPPAPARRSGLDESLQQFGDGTRRRSATLLLQEYLNAAEECVWGLVTDGLTLRVMRDNVSLTRPAWIEADLSKIFSEGLFPDFSALWLLIHQSRFGKAKSLPTESSLELWRDTGRIEGVAARDKLRRGVEAALIELGQGFIEHPANGALRQALTDGKLTRQGYFEELLRLVYRLIFLFAAEDRELLHAPGAPQAATKAYADGYSLARLRERCMRRTAWDRHGDAWEGLKATFAALGKGEPRLGLPALGGLFADGQLPDLTGCKLDNRRMLAAIWRLAWMRPDGHPLTRVNWRDMETEELGSVYESLLELTPIASADTKTFTFAEGDETRGNARKISGSYYTPDPLVKLLLDGTLEPVLDAAEARAPDNPAAELLKLTIVDPACGSGHFLLAAARRIASRIAKFRSPAAPNLLEFQHALREVVSHCIYGVDRNPMAVELCKVALWIEALEPGRPLTFLDSHIRCGDSLIGLSDLQLLKGGVPDEAYKALTGDIKDVAKACTKFNKAQRDGLTTSGFLTELKAPTELIDGARVVIDMPEETVEDIAAKQTAFEGLHSVGQWHQLNIAADLFVAAFFTPKTGDVPEARSLDKIAIPLTSHVWAAVQGVLPPEPLASTAARVARAASAFHWPLEFPHIFGRGGFDAVVGNPPWERIKLQEQEFFAARSPEIAQANKAGREILIKKLATSPADSADGRLLVEFEFAKRIAEAGSEFARNSGRYPLTGTGDVNTYALFAEHFSRLTREGGRAGILVPTGIATDSSTSAFFGNLISHERLRSLYSFYEIRKWFKGTDDRKSFCVLCVGAGEGPAEFCFDVDVMDDIANKERRFTLSPDQIVAINPNTKTAPVFRARVDAALTAAIYGRTPIMVRERPDSEGGDVNPWNVTFQAMFHMSGDSNLFADRKTLVEDGWIRDGTDWLLEYENGTRRRVPLYEAKMIHHFDHRWATYDGGNSIDEDSAREVTAQEKVNKAYDPEPRYWVPEIDVKLRAARLPSSLKRAFREHHSDRCLKALAEWICGYYFSVEGRFMTEAELLAILGREHAWRTVFGKTPERWLLEPKTKLNAVSAQRATPLTSEDVQFVRACRLSAIELVATLVDRFQPRWLMGWRDISLRSVERTLISSVLPAVGTGDTLLLMYPKVKDGRLCGALNAHLCSLVADYCARQKVGGSHLKYNIFQQLPTLAPTAFDERDLAFITPRVLELTYTSMSMRLWAEDLGYKSSAPFAWSEERRAILRAELDAFFAWKLELRRDELRYVLNPADAKGASYPSETFRVLKDNEEARFGEYRTGRLVLQAFDHIIAGTLATEVVRLDMPSIQVQTPTSRPAKPQDGAWGRPISDPRGETGAMLVAVLKAMDTPLPARHVRVAAMLALEPRLLHSQLTKAQSAEWQRLIGDEAKPLPTGTPQFVPPSDQNWGAVVRGLRTRGALVEDAKAGTWAPGKGLDKIETDGWPDGRARFVLDVLRASGEQTLVEALPAELKGWLDAEAA